MILIELDWIAIIFDSVSQLIISEDSFGILVHFWPFDEILQLNFIEFPMILIELDLIAIIFDSVSQLIILEDFSGFSCAFLGIFRDLTTEWN